MQKEITNLNIDEKTYNFLYNKLTYGSPIIKSFNNLKESDEYNSGKEINLDSLIDTINKNGKFQVKYKLNMHVFPNYYSDQRKVFEPTLIVAEEKTPSKYTYTLDDYFNRYINNIKVNYKLNNIHIYKVFANIIKTNTGLKTNLTLNIDNEDNKQYNIYLNRKTYLIHNITNSNLHSTLSDFSYKLRKSFNNSKVKPISDLEDLELNKLKLFGKFKEFYLSINHEYAQYLHEKKSLIFFDHWIQDSYNRENYIESWKLPVTSIISILNEVKSQDNSRLPEFEGAYPIGQDPKTWICYNVFKVKQVGGTYRWGKFSLGYDTGIFSDILQYYKIMEGWCIRTGVSTNLGGLTTAIHEKSLEKLKQLLKTNTTIIISDDITPDQSSKFDDILAYTKENNDLELDIKKDINNYAYYYFDFKYDRYSKSEHACWFSNLKILDNPIDFISNFIDFIIKKSPDKLTPPHKTDDYEYTDDDDKLIYSIQREFILWREAAIEELINPPLYV